MSIEAAMPKCEQCGMFHPPVKPGESCPMSKKISKTTGEEIDLGQFLTSTKNILESQIEKSGIKDTKKFTQSLTLEIMKFCENYKE